jgi:hypothetical protein
MNAERMETAACGWQGDIAVRKQPDPRMGAKSAPFCAARECTRDQQHNNRHTPLHLS